MRTSAIILGIFLVGGCRPGKIEPVDIFPEDICGNCRMAISDKAFASEIITEQGEVQKFDDIGCMESYRIKNPGISVAANFVSDYETKAWLRLENSIIMKTGIETPMGSGKIALSDSAKAKSYADKYPLAD